MDDLNARAVGTEGIPMLRSLPRRLRPLLAAALALLSLLVLPAAASAACPRAGQDPISMSGDQRRATTLCLLNAQRRAHGLPRLRLDSKLIRAARRHSRDMVARRYFSHDSLDGRAFSARIARTGWMHGRSRWSIGENLAWGAGSSAAPRSIVRAWMRSPGHKRNVLDRRFRMVGIGIVSGVPVGPRRGATYTTDFGA